ncbi:MAG: hypothetical protein ACE361_20810 [Aureliella sp.]
MHSVDLLEEAIQAAMNLGIEVRQEWLGEQGGGLCRLGNRWILYVDLSMGASDQLEQVLKGLRKSAVSGHDSTGTRIALSPELRSALAVPTPPDLV